MEINQDDLRLFTEAHNLGLGSKEWILEVGHKDPALEVEHRINRLVRKLKHSAALTGRARRVIERTDEASLFFEQQVDFFLVPKMVAAGHHIHPGRENFFGGFDGNTRAAGAIFGVRNNRIDGIAGPEHREELFDRPPPRFAHDVANKQNLHPDTVGQGSGKGKGDLNMARSSWPSSM